MKTLNVTTCLFLALILSACHPSATDKKDVQDGITFAEYHLIRMGQMAKTYNDWAHTGEFSCKSKYFKGGVDYLLMKIAYQEHQSIEMHRLGDFNNRKNRLFLIQENIELKRDLAAVFSTTLTALHQDLDAISMTPETFGQMVGDSNVPAMMTYKPFPPNF